MKLLLIIILLGAGGAAAYFKPWEVSQAVAAEAQQSWIAVEARERDLSSFVLATGIVRPQVGAEVEVGSRASGILSELHCDVGTHVKAGDLLAELDPTEFEAVRKQAAASLENARAERDYAETSYKRKKDLGEKLVPGEEMDLSLRAYRVASANLIGAEATLESAQIKLGFTRIVSPIPGVVASVSTQVGETVAASFSAPTFVTIIDLDRLEVWAYVDETDIGRVEVGSRATFTVDTYANTEFVGRVAAIYPKAEVRDNVVNYVVIIEIVEDGGKVLRPEMTATTKIALEEGGKVLCVPNAAIRTDPEGSYVMLQEAGGDPIRRAVTLGVRGRGFTQVVDGLATKQRVLMAR